MGLGAKPSRDGVPVPPRASPAILLGAVAGPDEKRTEAGSIPHESRVGEIGRRVATQRRDGGGVLPEAEIEGGLANGVGDDVEAELVADGGRSKNFIASATSAGGVGATGA